MNPSLNKASEFVVNPRYRVWQYMLFCALLFALMYFQTLSSIRRWDLKPSDLRVIFIGLIAIYTSTIITLLFHLLFLTDFLLKKGNIRLYSLGFLGIVFLNISLEIIINRYCWIPYSPMKDFSVPVSWIITTTLFYAIFHIAALGLKVLKMWILESQRRQLAEIEAHKAQLEILKSQINPHFLFNTLNNVYVLNKTRPEAAGEIILGLSDLLRYQLYEGNQETVAISKEINFIESWLSLEKIRRHNAIFSINIEGKFETIQIPPLLFTNFIDNAIKYGSEHGEVKIDFKFYLKNDRQIVDFSIVNTKNTISANTQSVKGGLGLDNIKKRLALLFPGKHTLTIENGTQFFRIHLILAL